MARGVDAKVIDDHGRDRRQGLSAGGATTSSRTPAPWRVATVEAGFTDIELETVALSSRISARDAAPGTVLGSPFRSEIERRDPASLDRAVNAVTEALAPWDGKDHRCRRTS
jgi:hypothetical protein